MINLPYGGAFDEQALVAHIQASGRVYIIQGQQTCTFVNHSKPQSLDYWLRENYANNSDTKQAENSVLNDLANTGLFTEGGFVLSAPEGSLLADFVGAGEYFPAIADGYWLMLAPLSKGKHTLQISASGSFKDGSEYSYNVTYNLTVANKKKQ